MAYVLVKRGKFLSGISYCTGFPERFSWTDDESKARRFGDGEDARHLAHQTGGRFEHRANTKAELKKIAKVHQDCLDRGFRAKTIHDRINARAAKRAGA